ncbi:hypothetical protein MZC50_09125 [Yersinia pestis subsp. pestis]|uniref:hypothetical protein n=1 Tax=Yersinia pestis TaxID=632 RepID=UPI0021F319AA|nr:hypothetical protein [Yersinia pestis]MCV6862058.1 hypothetical protein [Yersinia pestis subsp. pestis]
MRKPAFNVYITNEIESNGEKRTYWTRIGAAFSHNDNPGFNIVLTPGISVSGKLVLLEPKIEPKDEESSPPLTW